MNETQGAEEYQAERVKRLPRVLRAYARDVERYGRPVDSGLPSALRLAADVLAGSDMQARVPEHCAQCEYCGQDERHIEAAFPTCEHPLRASLPLRYRELGVNERTDPPPAWCPLRCQHRRVTRDEETAYCDDCGKRCDYNAETRNWE